MKGGVRGIRTLCFDFDGVIVDSATLKVDAFLELYAGNNPSHLEEIRRYCEYHGGMSRQRKIEYIQDNILGEPISQGGRDALAEKFRGLVLEKVLNAPVVPGAQEFLEAHSGEFTCFIVSGTPHEEINTICEKRGFSEYFNAVGGSPTEKSVWIARFMKVSGAEPIETVMIGDAPTDYDAAAETGVHFIGVGARPESLLPETEALIPDLTGLMDRIRGIEASIAR